MANDPDNLSLQDIVNQAAAGANMSPAAQPLAQPPMTNPEVPQPPTLTNTPLAPALAGPSSPQPLAGPQALAPSEPSESQVQSNAAATPSNNRKAPALPPTAPGSATGLGGAPPPPQSFMDKLKGAAGAVGQGVLGATGMTAFEHNSVPIRDANGNVVGHRDATPEEKGQSIMGLLGRIGNAGAAAVGSPQQKQQAIERMGQANQLAQMQNEAAYRRGMLGIGQQKANTGEERVGNQNVQAYAKLVAANQNHFLKEAPGSSPDNPSFVPMTADDIIAHPGLQGNRDLQQAAILDKQNHAALLAAETDAKNNPNSATQKAVQARLDILRQNANTSHSNLLLNQEKFGEQQRVNAATLGTAGPGGTPGTPGAVAPAPLTGDAYLATLPPARANILKAIAEGRIELSPTMMRGKEGQAIAQQLSTYAPDFDQSRAGSYFNMRKDYTSGPTSKALNSYNTAISHLSTMRDHVHDSNFADLNNPASDTYRRMALDKQLVATELAKAVSANQMTEKEKGDILNSLSSYTTHGYEQKIQEAVSLLKGKLDSYQNQWDNGAPPGAVSQLHMLSPQAEHSINHIYSDDPSEPANTQPVKPRAPVQAPNSGTKGPLSAAEASAYLRSAGGDKDKARAAARADGRSF